MGETRVDLQHLLEDLRDAYTGTLEETILTEIVANALDSGATRIRLQPSAAAATLTVIDDGRGMQRRDLARYHDVAASTKSRGEGIGFAGVGIKLGLLVSAEVVTETRRGATHVSTRWHLASRYRAPWRWIPPPGLVGQRGTAVRLNLTNPLSPLLDPGFVEEAIRRHFEPLLDPGFDDLLRRHYPRGIAFEVDGRPLAPAPARSRDRATILIRIGRRRIPSAVACLERRDSSPFIDEDREGIAVSTFGKVIKRGWDWLGITPVSPARVTGLIEAPDLAGCLTLSKNDFIRTGPRGATYLAYRKAIQEVVTRQLTAWGDARATDARPRTARLERDLERVLEDLSDDFPLLRSLVDHRAGGQHQLPLPGKGREQVSGSLFADLPADPTAARATADGGQPPPRTGATPEDDVPPGAPETPKPPSQKGAEPPPTGATPGADTPTESPTAIGAFSIVTGRRRPARYGLLLQFESRPDDSELGRLVDSTIWVNDAHPAYLRANASRSAGYHIAMAVALALAPLAGAASGEHEFITQFLAHWGGSAAKKRVRARRAGQA